MFKPDNEKLVALLDKVQNYELQLPEFQREWVWEDNRIRSLLASLTLGYPIGAIMLLETGGNYSFKCKSVAGSGNANKEPNRMILDGQQRITSTFLSMRCKNHVNTVNEQKKPIRRYYYLDIEKALDSTIDREEAIIAVNENKKIMADIGRTTVLDLSQEQFEFDKKMIPFNILTVSSEINAWRNKYQEYHNFNPDIIKQYQKIDELIIQPLLNYDIPIINILKDTPKEAVCQVFENVNTGGVPLNAFELLTASFAADNYDLKSDWESIRSQLSVYPTLKEFDNMSFMTSIVLLVEYKEGRTLSCKKKDILNLMSSEYIKYKNDLVNGLKIMYDILVDMCIFSSNDIPYGTQLIPLSVVCAIVGNKVYDVTVKNKIKQWYWCGVFGELYSSANETRYVLDVPQLINWLTTQNSIVPKTVSDCNFSTMRLIGLQTRNSAAYKGVNALILCNNAKDWISSSQMAVTNYIADRADIHHIFPKDYCETMNYDKKKWDSVINKTPLFFVTNRYIGGVAPSKYIERIINSRHIDESNLKQYVESHAINYDLLKNDNFNDYIIDRAKQILNLIEFNTGKKITDRNSQEVIDEFGCSLS